MSTTKCRYVVQQSLHMKYVFFCGYSLKRTQYYFTDRWLGPFQVTFFLSVGYPSLLFFGVCLYYYATPRRSKIGHHIVCLWESIAASSFYCFMCITVNTRCTKACKHKSLQSYTVSSLEIFFMIPVANVFYP